MKKIYYLIGGLVTIVPILIFILNFKSQNLSSNNSDWANFSTYLAGFVSLANLIVFIFLTEELHLYNKKKDDNMSKAEKPIISFKRKSGHNKYFAENVGKGTALNVVINGSLGDDTWNESYIYYCFSANAEKEVCVKHNNALIAKYEDIYGNKYVSYMDGDELRYFEIEVEKTEKKYSKEFERANYKAVKPTSII